MSSTAREAVRGLSVSTIALGEALLCLETLKCVDTWLETDELDRAKDVLATRLDAVIAALGCRSFHPRPGSVSGANQVAHGEPGSRADASPSTG
jgi:hypothetical protein